MYIIVSPFFKSFDDIWLTYHVPDFLVWKIKTGIIVEIPFKNNIEYWVILNIFENLDNKIEKDKIKSIINIHNDNIFLSNYRQKLLPWIAKYYITPIHNSNNLFFPKNLTTKIINDKLKNDIKNNFEYSYNYEKKLSIKQNEAYEKIIEPENHKILFYWLTWSWKTEIYIKLINKQLKKWKQSLLLIPEIVLTNQISNKIKNVFWNSVIIINSTITDATKTKHWLSINSNQAKVVIWTRSSLFYPYNNLWLIIIDEEHDNSYISDSAPRYNTIKVAEKITELNWNKLILASWTPSIKSMYKWVKGKYNIVNLLEKYE
jgi:primosomal protein N'